MKGLILAQRTHRFAEPWHTSVDGLKGFPEAIAAIFPQTEVQLCIIHQIRNSLRYVASKNQKAFMADLKPVYRADTKQAAEISLDEMEAK